MRPQLIQDILKEKHAFPVFSNRSSYKIISDAAFLTISLDSVFYFKK